jgi:hypothetical protein
MLLNIRRISSDELVPQGQCDTDITLKWMTEVSSSVYATPIIYDLFSDGHKDIIVPSFVHYTEASLVLSQLAGHQCTLYVFILADPDHRVLSGLGWGRWRQGLG